MGYYGVGFGVNFVIAISLVWSASANQLSVVQFNHIARFKILLLVWA